MNEEDQGVYELTRKLCYSHQNKYPDHLCSLFVSPIIRYHIAVCSCDWKTNTICDYEVTEFIPRELMSDYVDRIEVQSRRVYCRSKARN